MSGGTQQSSTSSGPPQQFIDAFQQVNQRAQNVANTPNQSYSGQLQAPLSPDQLAGISQTRNAQGIAAPYINAGAQYIDQATTPIWDNVAQFSPDAVRQFESPYTNDVVDATQAQFNNQNAIQQQGIVSNAIKSGAWGGDRSAVAQAITAGQQQLAQAPVIAGLRNTGYQQALDEFNKQQGAQIGADEANAWLNSQAGYGIANLGQMAQNSTLAGANALFGVGGLEQQQAQQSLNIPYQQFIQQQAYPFQTTGWLANIAEGLGSASGGTSTTTSPAASGISQIGGGAIAGAGILGQTGAYGGNGWLTNAFSSGAGAAGSAADGVTALGSLYWTGGSIPERADGGIVPSGIPDVSIGFIDQDPAKGGHLGGMFGKPIQTTQTITGPPQDSTIGTILKTAGQIAAAVYGGPAGAAAGSAFNSQVHFADGGIVANDNRWWNDEPEARRASGGIAVPMMPTSNPNVSMMRGTHGNTIPQFMPGGIAPSADTGSPALDDYLRGVAATASHATPETWHAPEASAIASTPSPDDRGPPPPGYPSWYSVYDPTSLNGGAQSGWRGGSMPHRDVGGILDDPDSQTSSIQDQMLDAGTPRGKLSPAEAKAWWQLRGASPAGASGIVQNMTRESGLDSTISGDKNRAGDYTSLGLFQHHNDRKASLIDYAHAQGTEATNPYTQMQFADKELQDQYPDLRRALTSTDDPALAESRFRKEFERPKEAGINGADSGIGPAPDGDAYTFATDSSPVGIAPPPVAADMTSPWRALTNIGLGIMGGTSPQAGVNIGRGALQGLEVTNKENQVAATQALATRHAAASDAAQAETARYHRATEANAAQSLSQAAERARAQLAESARGRDQIAEIQRAQLEESKRLHDQPTYTYPPGLGPDPDDPSKQVPGVYKTPNRGNEPLQFIPGVSLTQKGAASASTMPDDTRRMLAERVIAGDTSSLAGLGSGTVGAQNRMAIQTEVTKMLRDQGHTGADLAAKAAEYMGERAGARTAGTREANVNMAVIEAQKFVPLAVAASEKVDRTQFPTINSIIQAFEKGTGDENIVRLAVATNSLTNAYSRAITPSGIPTEGNQTRARELLDRAWSKGQYRAAVDQLMQEMQAAKASPVQAQEEQRARISGRPTKETPAPTAWKYNATGASGAVLHSNDGKSWFKPDGKPYTP